MGKEETFRVETLDDNQVEGRSEGESVVQQAVECQEGMTEDEVDEVSGEECNVLKADPGELKLWQQRDPSLAKSRELAGENRTEEPDGRVHFFYQDGLLYRRWRPENSDTGDLRSCEQLVLPQECHSIVLRLAHGVPMAGHLGVTKTKDHVLRRYYWPGIFKDIADYCRTCEVCQRSQPDVQRG